MNEKQVNEVGKREKRENYIRGMTVISFLLLVLEMRIILSHQASILVSIVLNKICQKTRLHLTF